MKCTIITISAVVLLAGAVSARPHGHPPPPPRPVWHGGHVRPPRWGWGVNVSPWGSTIGIGTRVGHHGSIGFTLPLTPPPVIRESTVVVQQAPVVQQPIVVQQPVVVQPVTPAVSAPGILPAYAPKPDNPATANTWVEGYWKVVRDPNGKETSRTWVPGHWEK